MPSHSRQVHRLAPLLLAVVLGAYLLSFHDVDLNLADEGFFLTHALSIERGALDPSSVDRLLKRQTGFLYHTWFQLAGHRDVKTARMLWVLLRVVLALMVLALARRIVPWPVAAAAAVLTAIAIGPWHKTWYPFSFGLMLYLAGRSASPRAQAVVAGLAGGALVTLHPVGVGVFVVLPAFGFLVFERLIDRGAGVRAALWTALVLGASAGAGLLVLCTLDAVILVLTRGADPALIWRGPISALQLFSPVHLASALRYSSQWAGQGRLPLSALFAGAGSFPLLGLLPGLVFLLQPLVLALVLLLLRRGSDRPSEEKRLLWLLAVLAAASLIKTCARTDLFHVMHAAAPSYILMLYLLWRAVDALSRRWQRTRHGARAAATVGLVLAGTLFPLGYTAAVLLSPSQWAASIGSLARAERRLRLERGGVRLTEGRAAQLEAVVQRIQAWTDPADPIFVMPFCPALYFLADRLCVADDDVFPKGLLAVVPGLGLSRSRADEHLARLLRSRRVKLVVQCPGFDRLAAGASIPRTRALLLREYEVSYEIEGTRILRLRAGRRAGP